MRVLLLVLAAAVAALAQTPYTHFETAPVHPLRLSADGHRLLVCNTAGNALEVFSLVAPDRPVLVQSIPVGLEPVSVTPRTADEVWVVNGLSDSVSIVSLSLGRVTRTLRVRDEPADVAFAGTPQRAFVSVSASDEVRVFDPVSLAPVATLPIFGKDPRALAVSATGDKVWVLVHRSGNRTAILDQDDAPPPPAPTNPGLPAAPDQGLVISLDDPQFAGAVAFDLPDRDVLEIDVATLAVTASYSGVGTINFDLAVDPGDGSLVVVNTNARNHVRFEPNVRGHVIDSRVTRVVPGAAPSVTPIDLNPGIDYAQLPNAAARATALAEPTGVVVDGTTGRIWIAAQGTDRIGVLDTSGGVLARIEIGPTTGSAVNTLAKRGPRALALKGSRLYVLNRLSHTLATVDTVQQIVLSEVALGHDPMPAALRDGRKFLYDAKLSGNGTASCAACHIDGDLDGLAWDLGDPGGQPSPLPAQPFPFNIGLPSTFHPMKGAMLTQTLRGLGGEDPFHWRGDRADLAAFNGAFDSLLGGTILGTADLALFTGFMAATAFPPNPNQNLDRTLATTPASANAAEGENVFFQPVAAALGLQLSCATCHSLQSGGSPNIISPLIIQRSQGFKAVQLRNVYRRLGASHAAGDAKAGFGVGHDGAFASALDFLSQPVFSPWPQSKRDDLAAFVLSFDTGTAPAVGYQVSIDATNAISASAAADVALLQGEAAVGNCDLVAKGYLAGFPIGLVYDPGSNLWLSDHPADAPRSFATLQALALAGTAAFTVTGVAPGNGTRIGRDRDLDGTTDAVDGSELYGAVGASLTGAVRLTANREAAVGTAGFAIVCSNVPPSALGVLAVSGQPAQTTVFGLPIFIDATDPGFFQVPFASDAAGTGLIAVDIPPIAALAGLEFYYQAGFFAPGAPSGFALSNGLRVVIQ